jgi:hypothetical protein
MRGGGTHVPNRRLGTDGKRVDQLLPLQKHMHPLLALKLRLRCHCTFAVALSCSGLVVAAKMGKSKKSERDKPDKNSKSRDRTVEIVCYKVCKTKAKPGEKAAWERFRQGGKFTVKAHSGSNFQELAVEIRKGLQIDDQAVFHDARLAGIDVHSDRLVLAAAAAAEAATPQVGLVDAPSGSESDSSDSSDSDSDDSGSDSDSDDDAELPGSPLCDVAAAAQRYISDQARSPPSHAFLLMLWLGCHGLRSRIRHGRVADQCQRQVNNSAL